MASVMTVNFATSPDVRQHRSNGPLHDRLPPKKNKDGKSLTPKQIRTRLRRKAARGQLLDDQEMEYLYRKPVEDWDLEELANGRPRNAQGHFKGPKPKWIDAQVHERAMEKYTAAIKTEMRSSTVDAVGLIKELITSEATDDRGKPIVPASTKLDAAKFLLEHVVGKPTQRIESDVSVKLQGILGQVMVNPEQLNTQSQHQYMLGHYPGITMALGEAADDDEPLDEG